MLNELLIDNKVVFAHVQRTVYGLNENDEITEDYLFKTPSSKYHHSSRGEWLTLYDEKENGEIDLRRGLPHFGVLDEKPCLEVQSPLLLTRFYSSEFQSRFPLH